MIILKRMQFQRKALAKALTSEWHAEHLLFLSRLGLLVLAMGTFFDNLRTPSGYERTDDTWADRVYFWVCDMVHEVLAFVCPAIGVQLAMAAGPGARPWAYSALAWVTCGTCLALGGYGFATITAQGGLYADCEYRMLQLHPENHSPFGLISVFAYSFAVTGAGLVLCARQGPRRWSWFVVVQVIGIVGQALRESFGLGIKVYSSNFWEQVTIWASLAADGMLNEGPESWLVATRGGYTGTASAMSHTEGLLGDPSARGAGNWA